MLYSFPPTQTASLNWMATNLPLLTGATILYSGALDVVFTIPRFPGVFFKFSITNANGYTFVFTTGDGWTAGATLVNPVVIHPYDTAPKDAGFLIVTPSAIVILVHGFSTNHYVDYVILGTLTTGDFYGVGCFRTPSQGGVSQCIGVFTNLTQKTSMKPNTLAGTLLSPAGHYYSLPYYLSIGSSFVGSMVGVKSLLMPNLTGASYLSPVGNDIIITGATTNGASDVLANCVIIEGGNI